MNMKPKQLKKSRQLKKSSKAVPVVRVPEQLLTFTQLLEGIFSCKNDQKYSDFFDALVSLSEQIKRGKMQYLVNFMKKIDKVILK